MLKRFIFILTSLAAFSSCADSANEEIVPPVPEIAKDSLTLIEADFIHLADAAVLKGQGFIYGVELDSTAKELVNRTKSLKRSEFDMIPVTVKGQIIKNPRREGWDEIIKIIEILEVPEKKSDSLKATDEEYQNPMK